MSEEKKTSKLKDEQLEKVAGGNRHQDFQKVTLEIGYYRSCSTYFYCSTSGEKTYNSPIVVIQYHLIDGFLHKNNTLATKLAGILTSYEKVAPEDVPPIEQ